ncbi:hypothetical protein Goshw_007577, partial [Gossypium schwendimanii]|nr:hypothetical protein [Gossypium schwendimanii]
RAHQETAVWFTIFPLPPPRIGYSPITLIAGNRHNTPSTPITYSASFPVSLSFSALVLNAPILPCFLAQVIKPYTPTTLDSDVGYFELVIKMYPQGRMSHHFRELRVSDYLDVKGPK